MLTNSTSTGSSGLPSLPIITPPEPARSDREKYGTLFFLGIAGLLVLLALVGWFGYRLWTMRDIWSGIYLLNDAGQPEEKRIQAAFTLSHDPRLEQNQLWDLSMNRKLPELARYTLAERIGTELVARDPRSYASAVTLSPDWPSWLRLVLVRPLAYAATRGHALSRERLGELCRRTIRDDPAVRLWVLYALAVQTRPDPQTVVEIERVARSDSPESELARLLLDAIESDEAQRISILDRATAWNREHHPDTRRIWQGWTLKEGKLERL
ncbi:MAG: hypothetical protein ACP5XB_09435 [Isosphaeraceae bacterium]